MLVVFMNPSLVAYAPTVACDNCVSLAGIPSPVISALTIFNLLNSIDAAELISSLIIAPLFIFAVVIVLSATTVAATPVKLDPSIAGMAPVNLLADILLIFVSVIAPACIFVVVIELSATLSA